VVDFTMPSLGADMDEGTLLEWLVHPGDTVHKGDVVAVVDTSKSAVEVESFHDGVMGQLLVEPGTTVPVGTVLATIDGAAARPAAEAAPAAEPAAEPAAAAPRVHSPLVRQDAARLGVDLEQVRGTGPGGTVTREDVRAHRPAAPAERRGPARPARPGGGRGRRGRRVRATPYARRLAQESGIDLEDVRPADGETVHAVDVAAVLGAAKQRAAHPDGGAPAPTPEPARPSGAGTDAMRATIAATMARSKREVPHYYLSHTVDLHAPLAWMQERNRALPVERRLLPAALVVRAVGRAAAAMPLLNGFWVDGAFRPGDGVHVGVAVSLRGGGLVAPAILDADTLSVEETMERLKDLVARTRSGRLRSRELSAPTITVTNLGEQGVESVHGVIHAPQVALVGVGRVVERPWAVDGMVGVRPVVTLTLAADHRATDGFVGSRFLATLEHHLQHPEEP
jgi:pyruvate dehydrogenase E2 component (dihydrolipoamide acetyltransferase)